MLDLVDDSVDMNNVGGDDVLDGSNVSGGNVISFEDMDEVSVNVAGLDVLSLSDVAPDGFDHVVQLLASDFGSLEIVVSLSDDGVSKHASDVLGNVLMRPLGGLLSLFVPSLPVMLPSASPSTVVLVDFTLTDDESEITFEDFINRSDHA